MLDSMLILYMIMMGIFYGDILHDFGDILDDYGDFFLGILYMIMYPRNILLIYLLENLHCKTHRRYNAGIPNLIL